MTNMSGNHEHDFKVDYDSLSEIIELAKVHNPALDEDLIYETATKFEGQPVWVAAAAIAIVAMKPSTVKVGTMVVSGAGAVGIDLGGPKRTV